MCFCVCVCVCLLGVDGGGCKLGKRHATPVTRTPDKHSHKHTPYSLKIHINNTHIQSITHIYTHNQSGWWGRWTSGRGRRWSGPRCTLSTGERERRRFGRLNWGTAMGWEEGARDHSTTLHTHENTSSTSTTNTTKHNTHTPPPIHNQYNKIKGVRRARARLPRPRPLAPRQRRIRGRAGARVCVPKGAQRGGRKPLVRGAVG